MPIDSDIEWALDTFFDGDRIQHYQLAEDYYYGNHRLSFATDRFRKTFGSLFTALSDNLCASVIDVKTERLELVGFGSSAATSKVITDEGTGATYTQINDDLAERAWDLWEDNAMDIVADEVHRHSFQTGNGYVIVWPSPETGQPEIWCQKPSEIAVRYSKEQKDTLELAAKMWATDDNRWRLTLYYPDRIERLISVRPFNQASRPKRDSLRTFQPPTPNPYGRVPVFHFPNRAYMADGVSDLRNVIPVQDALNKSIADLLIAMEFQSYKQRWATGLEPEVDPVTGLNPIQRFASGADSMITAANEDAKFGEFGETNLLNIMHVVNDFRAEIARVSGIPIHYFHLSGSVAPSGEALKTAELRFERQLKKLHSRLGKQWEDVIAFALRVGGEEFDNVDFNAQWLAATSRTENELMDVSLKKKEIGVPLSQLQKEHGYDADQIKQFAEENAARAPSTEPDDDSPEAAERRERLDEVVPPQSREPE